MISNIDQVVESLLDNSRKEKIVIIIKTIFEEFYSVSSSVWNLQVGKRKDCKL